MKKTITDRLEKKAERFIVEDVQKYVVLSQFDPNTRGRTLDQRVSQMLNKGWELLGGPLRCKQDGDQWWEQALIYRGKPSPKKQLSFVYFDFRDCQDLQEPHFEDGWFSIRRYPDSKPTLLTMTMPTENVVSTDDFEVNEFENIGDFFSAESIKRLQNYFKCELYDIG